MPLRWPNGTVAGSVDRTQLLKMWADHYWLEDITSHATDINNHYIIAGIGKPTYPICAFAAQAASDFWHNTALHSAKARHILNHTNALTADQIDAIAAIDAAIDYGNPAGDLDNRVEMAKILTKWYNDRADSSLIFEAKNILFTVGGSSALNNIFTVLNKKYPRGLIVTPFPHYSLYKGPHNENRLFPIDLMRVKGYQLTAEIVEKHLVAATLQAEKENCVVSAFILCDPSNPLGTVLSEDELRKIANVFKKYPTIKIILDEAYAELRHQDDFRVSLLKVAPELKHNIILLRSATKALSAAGERWAITAAFDQVILNDLVQESTNIVGNAHRSGQYSYTAAMSKLNDKELQNLRNYYTPQANYVFNHAIEMGAAMPDSTYTIGGAFYVVIDLSDLLGQPISERAALALGKTGAIENDEDIAYSLLADEKLMIAPLSYYGAKKNHGYMRITCSAGISKLEELMLRLEDRLVLARQQKQMAIQAELEKSLAILHQVNPTEADMIQQKLAIPLPTHSSMALTLKDHNLFFKSVLLIVKRKLNDQHSIPSATMLKKIVREHHVRKHSIL